MNKRTVLKRNSVLEQLLKNVIYNKHDIIAINKPYGLIVQGESNSGLSLTHLLDDFAHAKGLQTKPHIVHRLDRDSTGVLLLAKSVQAAQYLSEAFRQNKVKKMYWSIVVGAPKYDEGDVCIPLKTDMVNRRYKIVLDNGEHKEDKDVSLKSTLKVPAHTRFKVLAKNMETCTLLQLCPVTGYKHQLRVHLAKGLGTPILGDHKYSSEKQQPQVLPLRMLQMLGFKGVTNAKTGKRKIQPWQRALVPMHLHAKEIELDGLEKTPVIIKAPVPVYFTMTLSSLKLDSFRTHQKISTKEKHKNNLLQLGISTSHRSGF